MNRTLAFASILAALALQATMTQAAIILDNTSITQANNPTAAETFGQNLGFAFTPLANYTLDSLTLAISDNIAGSNTVSLALWNVDVSGLPTGTALATASETITVNFGTNPADVVALSLGSNATGSWDVTAGTTYALTFAGDSGTKANLFFSGADPTTSNASYNQLVYTGPAWKSLTSAKPWMQLSGTPTAVPEPSTWALALAGVTCSAWCMARRRRAVGSLRKA